MRCGVRWSGGDKGRCVTAECRTAKSEEQSCCVETRIFALATMGARPPGLNWGQSLAARALRDTVAPSAASNGAKYDAKNVKRIFMWRARSGFVEAGGLGGGGHDGPVGSRG